jgi:hypothetical protein
LSFSSNDISQSDIYGNTFAVTLTLRETFEMDPNDLKLVTINKDEAIEVAFNRSPKRPFIEIVDENSVRID